MDWNGLEWIGSGNYCAWGVGTPRPNGLLRSRKRGSDSQCRVRSETDLEKAERIIESELKRLKWMEEELRERSKGDKAKVKLAQRLRAETVQTVDWVANRLHMGSRAYVDHLLWRVSKELIRQ